MSRKKSKSKPDRGKRRPRPVTVPRTEADAERGPSSDLDDSGSSRAVEAMTVAWMLSFMASILGEAGTLISTVVLMVARPDYEPGLVRMIPGVLWFVAIVTGTCCLVLTLVVCRLRPVPPPTSLVRAAVAVGALPWVAILLTWIAQIAR